ncbi:Acid phosphatase [Operophtera brumata]|uniref:Acid phosphatase n=1 Tax=Operophtera brumata TaxID=104452 RepID=A0A0L7KYJ8_OPEBR|nr:Acid phosphatase [Operophtera brumata]
MSTDVEAVEAVSAQYGYGQLTEAVYQPSPGEDLVYLPIAGCDSLLCDLDQYKDLVSKYLLDEDTWRTECGFTDDLVVDASSID